MKLTPSLVNKNNNSKLESDLKIEYGEYINFSERP